MGSKPDSGSSGPVDGVEVRHLIAFVALAQALHFGRAGRAVGVSQSALSRTIAQLEAAVGEPLVDRSRPTTGLTTAGRAFLPHARAVIAELHAGIVDAGRPRDMVPVLGLMNSIGYEWLPPLHVELERRGEPAPVLRSISLQEGFAPVAGAVDVGIYPLPMVMPEGLRYAVLGVRRPWVALPAGHRLAKRSQVRLSDLQGMPAIAPPAHEVWDRNIELLLRAQDLELALGVSAGSMYEVLALVAAGRGWTISAAVGDFHPWDGVVFCPLAGVERFRVAAVWADEPNRRPRGERLVAALRAVARHADEASES